MALNQHPFGRVFTAAVGLGEEAVPDDWSAFDRKRIYFARRSTQLSKGDHLFAIGAARKRAVLGLFEITSSGTEPVASPEDPERWPHSVGVRPLAGVRPPSAASVPGVQTPRAFPQQVRDEQLREALYAAVEGGEEPAEEVDLTPGSIYTWEELSKRFGFEPNYISVAGGMLSRPELDALLLITHAGGARPNEYGDYWDGDELVYTGRGKRGDQKRDGQNRDLGDNRKAVFVFEPDGKRELQFLGQAQCVDEWTERDLDEDEKPRTVLRFQLRFDQAPAKAEEKPDRANTGSHASRKARPFDPSQAPKAPAAPTETADPEETQALREKAVKGHHDLLVALASWLKELGWEEVEEIPLAVDLWAVAPAGSKVIFEAKTVRAGSEGPRIRSAIAQLQEYRFFYGAPEDRLCLVCDRPISGRRVRLLDGLGIAVLWRNGEDFRPGSGGGKGVFDPLGVRRMDP